MFFKKKKKKNLRNSSERNKCASVGRGNARSHLCLVCEEDMGVFYEEATTEALTQLWP